LLHPLRILGALLLLAFATRADARPALYAEQVTAASADRLLVGGPDSIGGIDDWALGNGTLCAVVSDPTHETVLSPRGGVLVDLAHCGRDDDQWNVLQPLMNASRTAVPVVGRIEAHVDAGEARIETWGERDGIELATAYILDTRTPDVLRVRTRARRIGDGPWMRVLADVVLHGNGSLVPFTASAREPGSRRRAPGFDHPPVDPDSPLEMAAAIEASDLQIWVGGDRIEPGVAYGLHMLSARRIAASGEAVDLPVVSISGESFSLLGVLTRPFWLGGGDRISWLELAQAVLFDLAPGETIEIERELRVGRRADVASVTDALWPDAARVEGRVDDPAARLRVVAEAGGVLTEVRPEADGRFAFRAPPGHHHLRWRAPGDRHGEVEVDVPAAGTLALAPIATGAAARVALPRGQAMRLVWEGDHGKPEPLLRADLLDFRLGERRISAHASSDDVSLAGVPGDPSEITLRPGHYRVYATRGPEFDVTTAELDAVAGQTVTLAIDPPTRVVETPGWISADLHVHAIPSDDSTYDLDSRIRSLVAEGVDVAVATDHDRVTDYGPVIERLGLSDRLAGVVGSEITSTAYDPAVPFTAGHSNAFPLEVRPRLYAEGVPASEGRRLRAIRAELNALGGDRILQLNHPRPRSDEVDRGHFFEHMSVVGRPFDPTRPLSEGDNQALVERDPATGLRDLDFDAVELMNGPGIEYYYRVRADWLSLLLQGVVVTATANSDSHRASEVVGAPRNYLPVDDDRPGDFDDAALVAAVRAHGLYGTTGPLLDVRLDETRIGGLHRGQRGTLHVAVDAAPWVPVSELRVYVDGERVNRAPAARGTAVELPMHFDRDAFVTVEVRGRADATYAALLPDFEPLAFTNPIFVDADGDGRWTAPGLPASLPLTISHPEAGD